MQVSTQFKRQGRWLKYLGGFSSRRLTAALRLPIGLAEFLVQPASCDGKARVLVYVLSRFQIEACQFNLFSPQGAHTVALAKIDGRWRLLDPYYGVVFLDSAGELAGWDEVSEGVASLSAEELAPAALGNARDAYLRLEGATGGFEGKPLAIPVRLDASMIPLQLGESDGDSADVAASAARLRLGVGLDFLGPLLGSDKHIDVLVRGLSPCRRIMLKFMLVDPSAQPPALIFEPAQACQPSEGMLHCQMRADPEGVARLRMSPGGSFFSVMAVDSVSFSFGG